MNQATVCLTANFNHQLRSGWGPKRPS